MIKLIATDLDGTLLFPKKVISLVSKKNKKVLREFVQKGGHVVIASGRSLKMCQKIARNLKINCDFTPYSGGMAIVNNKVVDAGIISNDLINKIDDFIEKEHGRLYRLVTTPKDKILAYGPRLTLIERVLVTLYQLINLRYNEARRFIKIDQAKNYFKDGVCKMTLIYTKKDEETINVINKISEKFSAEVETFVTSRACEITLKGYNKGTMVKRIASSLNYENNEVAVIGDDINDVTMFKMFENSFVMDHASDEVKKYAKNIIVNFKDIKQML